MIREILQSLDKGDLDALKIAFEQGDSYYIIIDGHFVGVNTVNMNVTHTEGVWQYGEIGD